MSLIFTRWDPIDALPVGAGQICNDCLLQKEEKQYLYCWAWKRKLEKKKISSS